jgi:hypothetical protein
MNTAFKLAIGVRIILKWMFRKYGVGQGLVQVAQCWIQLQAHSGG